jgi:hypothetical protein
VRAVQQIAGETVRAGIACDARGHGLTVCRVDRTDAARIDLLAQRVRTELRESPRGIPRAAMLRALLLLGLETAESRGLAPPPLGHFSVRLEYIITAQELDRLERFRSARWSLTVRPPAERLQGAIVRLALELAESRESFAREVLSARLPRTKEQR